MAELTVASFNLHWGRGARRGGYAPFDVVAACRELDADVLVLQETWGPDGATPQHHEIATALGYASVTAVPMGRAVVDPVPRVVSRADPRRRKGTGDWSLAVLSRLPVTGTSVHALPQLPTDPSSRAVIRAEVDVDGRPLAVHGTHLPHLEMGAVLAAPALRRALVSADRPAVLLGDMNMWGWCISPMAGRGWTLHGRGATFTATRPLARIDHLLATAAVDVRSCEVVRDLGSDHRPIRARLRVAQA